MQHAPNFSKTVLLYRDDVVSRQDFLESEATFLIGERALRFDPRRTKQDHPRAPDGGACLIGYRARNLSRK